MSESERLQRQKEHRCYHDSLDGNLGKEDDELEDRIISLLNHAQIDKHCMVDAYYYDFSVIPHDIQSRLQLWRDAYLIFGITIQGEMTTKWVDRWDLDSSEPIVDGKVIHSDKPFGDIHIPEINQNYNPNLLSTPTPQCTLEMFVNKPTIPMGKN